MQRITQYSPALLMTGVIAACALVITDAEARSRSSSGSRSSSSARSHSSGAHVRSATRIASTPRTSFFSGSRTRVYAPVLVTPWAYSSPYPYAYPYSYPAYPYDAYGPYAGAYSRVPPVYVQEQGVLDMEPMPAPVQTAAAPAQQNYWYYCEESSTYYPYAQSCSSPWVRVIPYPLQVSQPAGIPPSQEHVDVQ